jgi:hypothetical protein
VIGIILTYNVLALPRRRLKLRDLVVGAVVMPVLAVVLVLCEVFEKAWKRLLIILDYNPPEEMRAGPKPPSEDGGTKPGETKQL